MGHFDINQWSDYVRGLTRPEDTLEMQGHLQECSRCASISALLSRIWTAAQNDLAFEPPVGLVAAAEQVFPAKTREARKNWANLELVLARLVHAGLAPAGTRSGSQGSRHVLYKAGNICVDVRVEKAGPSVNLVGQLADESLPEFPFNGLPVLLISRDRIIDQTTSNDLGEFAFVCQPLSNLVLRLPMERLNSLVEVPLSALNGEELK
jgi:hypothetical protein